MDKMCPKMSGLVFNPKADEYNPNSELVEFHTVSCAKENCAWWDKHNCVIFSLKPKEKRLTL